MSTLRQHLHHGAATNIPGGDVSGDEYVTLSVLELVKCCHTLVLHQLAEQRHGLEGQLRECNMHLQDTNPRRTENNN